MHQVFTKPLVLSSLLGLFANDYAYAQTSAATDSVPDQTILVQTDVADNTEPLQDNAVPPSTTAKAIPTPGTEDADGIEPATRAPNVEDEPLPAELTILKQIVKPGKSAVLKWEVEATFVDASAPVPVLVVNGTTPGPTLCLTAAIHGDELNGIEIVRRVVHEIDPEKLTGAVIGVPIVNLQGFQRANRYLPDRRDLNRYFPGRIKGSYASRIAHSFFSEIISHCDFLVDLHTGSLSRTNLPQIRANLMIPEVAALAEKMGSIVVLQSKGASGTLRRAATEAGIPAVTLEAGAPNNLQKDAVESGVKSVLSAMDSLGLTAPKPFWKRSQEPVFYQSTWIRARKGGILFSKVELGDTVKKGSVLGLLSDPISNRTTKIIAPIEGRVIGMALNQVMYPGFAAYHIGLKSSIVDAAQPQDLIPEEPSPDASDPDIAETSSTDIPTSETEEIDSDEAEFDVDESTSIEEMELPTVDADD
ncbi:hypothetical protein GCM10008090_00700 [Arenicella chitinivorans]|uniref:Succinylglutamate desuccinylase/Aspartoacylase catalytic domain-containing protein n=1 Tax=Arenicella chitinivorans TaxID=1329800 RepID=A0A918VHD6_9GAMM|nr:succinylglutamate desuccinylase/aspartoacylase family protein [Arenicella chitinivorans]GGZ96332.1 hypothetical protein GCM10008090_00700 [Arenicella chitinivorans]